MIHDFMIHDFTLLCIFKKSNGNSHLLWCDHLTASCRGALVHIS